MLYIAHADEVVMLHYSSYANCVQCMLCMCSFEETVELLLYNNIPPFYIMEVMYPGPRVITTY